MCAGTDIFLRFETDLNFSRPWFSEIKVQIKWPTGCYKSYDRLQFQLTKIQVIRASTCLFLCLKSSPENLKDNIQPSYNFRRILCSRCVIYKPAFKLKTRKADTSSHIHCHFTRLKHRRNRKLSKKWFSKPTKKCV